MIEKSLINKRSYIYRKKKVNKRCLDCGILIYQYSERCKKCAKKLLKLDDKYCIDCNTKISVGSKGRCRKCAPSKIILNPDVQKKKSEKVSISVKKRWENPEYKEKLKKSLSLAINKKYENEEYIEKRSIGIYKFLSKMSSKMELKVYEYIKDFGYLNSIRVGRYVVDFINNDNKIIIECYGDYWHCNPKIYTPDYFCKGKKLTAKEIWKSDSKRKLHLENLGYVVIEIWESEINENGYNIKNWIKNI